MADLSGLGWFAGGMARGIPVGQEMAGRQEAIKAAQDQRASREAGQAVQRDIASYDPNAAIPAQQAQQDPNQPAWAPGLPADMPGSAAAAPVSPYQRLDSIRASARSIPDPTIREAALKQVGELAMAGATHNALLAQQALKKFNEGTGSAADVVANLNNAFKFVDSNSPDNMFTVVPGQGGKPASIKDWKGDTVDDPYMLSIGLAARENPLVASEYLRQLSSAKSEENRKQRETDATIAYEKAHGQYLAATAYADVLRIQAAAGGTGAAGATFLSETRLTSLAREGVKTAVTDPALAPIINALPAQTEGTAMGIIGQNPGMPPAMAAFAGAVISGQSYANQLPDKVRSDLKDQFGETMMPYEVELGAPSDQTGSDGNPLAYQARIIKKDADGNITPMTPQFVVPSMAVAKVEKKRPDPGLSFKDTVEKAKGEKQGSAANYAPPAYGVPEPGQPTSTSPLDEYVKWRNAGGFSQKK